MSIYRLLFLVALIVFMTSCKSNSNTSPINTSDISSFPSANDSGLIGEWTLPITKTITNNVQLFYDSSSGCFYTKELQSGASTQDSIPVAVVKRENGIYEVEYVNQIDSYILEYRTSALWRSPGQQAVHCNGNINIDKLVSAYEQSVASGSSQPHWETANVSASEKAKFYSWSKGYVKKCVVEPNSLVFPNINDVSVSQKQNKFKIEYKASGIDSQKEKITYPVCIYFEKDNKGELTLLNITLE